MLNNLNNITLKQHTSKPNIRILLFLLYVLLFIFFKAESKAEITIEDKELKNEYVVLLHGLFRSHRQMAKIERHLTLQGYKVLNIDYQSTKKSLSSIADDVWNKIQNNTQENSKIHFVGYSMGGLVTRVLLSKYKPKNMGRVVLLATPNKGSEVADFFHNTWLYKKITGPAGQELITNQEKFKYIFSPVNYELGVLAGNFSIDILSSMIIKGDDDGKVSVENAKVEGMQDYKTISASHFTFTGRKDVIEQTEYFLKHGKFYNLP